MDQAYHLKDENLLSDGLAALCQIEAAFARVDPARVTLRSREAGFVALAKAIISQQVSMASANAITARLAEAGMLQPDAVLAASEADLRALGLSRQKAGYMRALAEARIDYARLHSQSTDEVVAALTAVKGIGRWTAEIYAMFALGHSDAFAAGDLALQEAARVLFDLPLRQMSAACAPWRRRGRRIGPLPRGRSGATTTWSKNVRGSHDARIGLQKQRAAVRLYRPRGDFRPWLWRGWG